MFVFESQYYKRNGRRRFPLARCWIPMLYSHNNVFYKYLSDLINPDMFFMLLFFCYTFTFHILHVINVHQYWHVCYVTFFFFKLLHFIFDMSCINTGMFVMLFFFLILSLRFISYMSSWIDTNMFVMLLFFFNSLFTFHMLHVLNRYWYVWYVTFFSFTLLYFISYMSSWINTDMFCYVSSFSITLLHFIYFMSWCMHETMLICVVTCVNMSLCCRVCYVTRYIHLY